MVASVRTLSAKALRLPFVQAFHHAAASRSETSSLLVKVVLEDGTVGWGEGTPRSYVTGEDLGQALAVAAWFGRHLEIGATIDDPEAIAALIAPLQRWPSVRCAVELAMLDALGRSTGRPVAELFGPCSQAPVPYSMVISAGSLESVARLCHRAKDLEFQQVKLKVGSDAAHDLACLRLVRGVLPKAEVRVDANGAWSPEQARGRCLELASEGVRIVEEPLGPAHRSRLAALRRSLGGAVEVLVDESVVTIQDARYLIESGAADRLLLKVSKHGGIGPTLAIGKLAEARGIPVHLGSHVGETSLLTAAAQVVAGHLPLASAEGAWGELLLQRDLTDPCLQLGHGGRAPTCHRPGLGVDVVPERARL